MKRAVVMDRRRFADLAQAYGADLNRWPTLERDAARALAERDLGCGAILAEAAALDELLEAFAAPAPSADLHERVLFAASSDGARLPDVWSAWPKAPMGRGIGYWLSGAGLAAAAFAGLLCGAAASSAAMADSRDEALVASATSDGLSGLNRDPAAHIEGAGRPEGAAR